MGKLTKFPVFRMLVLGGHPVGLVLCSKHNIGAVDGVMNQFGFSNYQEFVRVFPGTMRSRSKVFQKYFGWVDNDHNVEVKFNAKDFRFFEGPDYDVTRLVQSIYEDSINDTHIFTYPKLSDVVKAPRLRLSVLKELWFCEDWNEEWLRSSDGIKMLRQVMRQNQIAQEGD